MPSPFGFSDFGQAPIQVQLQGSDPATLDALSARIEAAVRAVPGTAGVHNENDNRQTQLPATVDWTRAADLGVNARDAGVALRTAIDGFSSNATQFRQTGRSAVPIRVMRDGADRLEPADLTRLPVAGARGPVELGQFATLREAQIPTSIKRVNRLRSITVSATNGDGVLVGDVQTKVVKAVGSVPLPPEYKATFAGAGDEGGNAFAEMGRAILVAVVLMYSS